MAPSSPRRPAEARLLQDFGPTALITGASDGIGRACAEQLAAQGFDLILVARSRALLDDLAFTLREEHGVHVRVHAPDLTDPEAVTTLLETTDALPIGLVVAAAGYGSTGRFVDQPLESELAMIDLNCRAVTALAHRFGQRMQARGRGGIMLFGSLVGFQGAPFSATYAATKSFVQSLAEGLAVELRPHGVSVLSVAPGPVGTGFASRAGMTMGKAARPDRVAAAALGALGRQGTVRPGFQSKALGWSLGMLPRGMRVLAMGRIMQGMVGKVSKTAGDNIRKSVS
ncbi:MAG: SDR family NAD(P)-dependent oxidoreductase [Paracoccus hibiscisoli]|uniref:SDR family NAD(P)-dependent oxidoreductase n=1 Tax=Paracoccus hibiscisoli TaxID=2023261 RepID=UPI003919CEBA